MEADVKASNGWRGIQAGDRLPSAVSLVRRNLPESVRNEVNTAFHQYGKSMTDLAKSARKMYKTARLKNIAPQPSVMEKVSKFHSFKYHINTFRGVSHLTFIYFFLIQWTCSPFIDILGLGPVKPQEQSTCAITERLTKLFFQDPWDFPKGGDSNKWGISLRHLNRIQWISFKW